MKLLLDNPPPSLQNQREVLAKCLEAINRALPVQAACLLGSHARGEARSDSDVDFCIVADGAERQLDAAACWRVAMREVGRDRPSR